MWRFVSGASKPPEKKRKTDNDKKEYDNQYDKKVRSREFVQNWCTEFQWVRYDNAQKKMYCNICEVHPKLAFESAFVKGCSSFRKENLTSHAASSCHRQCQDLQNVQMTTPGTSLAEKALQSINKEALEKMKLLFRTSHALAKHGRPFTDFKWQCALDKQKGLDVGNTYLTDKKCKEFMSAIAETELKSLENNLKSANYFSVMCDESTDSAVLEQVIVYVRYTLEGEIYTDFVAVKHVDRPNATQIFECILTVLREYCGYDSVDMKKHLVGFASDGAAVMRGLRNGVQAKLKENFQPNLVAIHCMAHCLELAVKLALSQLPLHPKIDIFLRKVYSFYHHSPVHRSLLKSSCEALKIKFYAPTRVGGTRWIPHLKSSVTNVIKIIPALHLTATNLLQDSNCDASTNSTCKLVKESLQSLELVQYLHFFCDILCALSYLSQSLQATGLTIAETNSAIQETICMLQKLSISEGFHLRSWRKSVEPDGRELKGNALHSTKKTDVINVIVSCLESRLTGKDTEMSELLVATNVFNFKTWPSNNEQYFGDRSIIKMLHFFSSSLVNNNVQCEMVEPEWTALKIVVYQDYIPVYKASWMEINKRHKNKFVNILSLVDLVLSLPAHTADCERGFSLMKSTKTDWRSKLNDDTLSSLMRIQMKSSSVCDFDPTPAVELWFHRGERKRRPFQPPYRKCIATLQQDEDASDDSSSDSSSDAFNQ